ncbi:MAG: acyltransferase family protein [Akkermansiaceae bacterium]
MNLDSSRLENFRYRPDVDGLRALAVIPVVFFHAALGFPGGFVGVDIFFVISGYLITTIITRDILRDEFSMKGFWERRIRRILPASAFMALCVLIAGAFILLPYQYEDLGKSAVSQTFMVSNFYFWQQDGYFAAPSDFELLLHTWSLAVEEQFYFLFPLLLVFLFKKGPKAVIWGAVFLFIISLGWSIYGVRNHPSATFYLLPARAWELLIGALIAIAPIKLPSNRTLLNLMSWLGVALIVFSFSQYSLRTPFPGIAALPPVLGAGLLILANRDTLTTPGKLLSLRPVVFIGKISYSLYLWHWPLLVFGKHLSVRDTPLETRWLLVGASFLMAVLSWRFIEAPFRSKTALLKSRKQVFQFFYVSTIALTLAGTVVYKLEGIPARFESDAREIAIVAEEELIVDDTKEVRTTGKLPLLGPPREGKVPLPVLIWGDSHAQMMLPVVRDLCNERNVDLYYSVRAAHPPILNTNRYPDRPDVAGFNDAVFGFVKDQKIRKIVLIARWTKYCVPSPDSNSVAITDREGSDIHPTEVFETYLNKMVATLHEMGIKVWIVRQIPYQERSPVELLFHAHRLGRDFDSLSQTVRESRHYHTTVNEIFNRLPKDKVTVIDPSPYFELENGYTLIHLDGIPIYFDEDHLTAQGSKVLRPMFSSLFDELEKP